MATNLVIHNDAPEVTRKGSFEQFDGYLAESARSLRAPAGSGSASARFDLGAAEPGFYEIFAWWPQNGGEGSTARVRVEHAEGETITSVDQGALGGQWNSLGVFELGRGTSGVTFQQAAGAPMLVDAVRIQFVGLERPQVVLKTTMLPLAELSEPYSAAIEGWGGIAPYSFDVADGDMPAGLELDSRTGRISGRPAMTGSYVFSVGLTDAAGERATASVELEVVESTHLQVAPVPGDQSGESLPETKSLNGKAAVTDLAGVVSGLPEGEWSRVNLNAFSDAWTPPALRTLYFASNPPPSKIIAAWSSFAWDPNRGNLILYGGGHANYRGNDVYIWRGSTRKWERGSLPSEMKQDSLGNWNAIDGADRAPASAHTYDNSVFLPIVDRFLTLGGAADSNGGHYMRKSTETTSRRTGPYMFDPSRADPWKVGGTTGSHVKRVGPYPEVVGGNMWSNRDAFLNPSPPTHNFVNGCTAYAQEGGKDVVYVRTSAALYRYTINSLSDSSRDTWQKVGNYWGGPGSKATCAYDPETKVLVRTGGNSKSFVYWDLNKAGPSNNDVGFNPVDPTGEFGFLYAARAIKIENCGLDFDRTRDQFALWCGDGRVWMMKPPASLSAGGWTIEKQRTPVLEVPNGSVGSGILGKWEYAPDLDVFVGLQDSVQGNVWIYKPIEWRNPGGPTLPPQNATPIVAMTRPAGGSTFFSGQQILLSADAGDADGQVMKVEYFNGASKIGEAGAAPYQLAWSTAPLGTHSLSAVATDDRGAKGVSAAVNVTVTGSTGGGATVVLQQGLNEYGLAADTYLSSYHKTLSFGSSSLLEDQGTAYSSLIRFAVLNSEGGPVPNGATVQSARLSLYKYSAYDMTYALHRVLVDWQEGAANWNRRGMTGAWTIAGANGAGTDYSSSPDATASVGFSAGWVEFDVTVAVQQMSQGAANHGWRLIGVRGNQANRKRFYTSNYASNPDLRPKLSINYR